MTKKEIESSYNDYLGNLTAENLKKRGFDAYYFPAIEEAVAKALSFIEPSSSVGWGGSASIEECGLMQKIRSGSFTLIDRETAANPDERREIMIKCLSADFFLTSFNAVSEDGVVVNIDGNGNRTSAIGFGPKNVIALVGINKIAHTAEDALSRARTTAARKNCIRFGVSPAEAESLCNIVQILKSGGKGRIKVLIVGEELGF